MLASQETIARLVKLSDLVSEPGLSDEFMRQFTHAVRGLPADSARLWTAAALDHVDRVVKLHDLLFGYPAKEECKAFVARILFKSRRAAIADELLEEFFVDLCRRRKEEAR
jgi:hypothetical protein